VSALPLDDVRRPLRRHVLDLLGLLAADSAADVGRGALPPLVRVQRPSNPGHKEGGVKDLRSQPWWTGADRAELDVLLHELVESVHDHHDRGCGACAAGYPPCPNVQKAIAVVERWREARILLSRAKWERSRQRLVEFEQELDELLAPGRAA
jgi:hypothetical protein